MAARVTYIHLELGTPTTGLWCDACMLPSLVEWPVLLIDDHGVSTVGWYRACTECGQNGPHRT